MAPLLDLQVLKEKAPEAELIPPSGIPELSSQLHQIKG